MEQTGPIQRSCLPTFLLLFQNVVVILYSLMSSVSGSPPYFIAPPGNADVITMVENIPPGTPIYLVVVGDPDSKGTLSTKVTGTSDFNLNPTRTSRKSILSPKRSFDYSNPADRSHDIMITVSDGTSYVSANLTVQVISARTQVDTISGNFTTELPEEATVGTAVKFKNLPVTKASAADVQVYSLSGMDANYFNIDRLTAEITVARRIDRDRSFHKITDLQLIVSNRTGYTGIAPLNVVIQDINDNPPVCNPSVYHFNVAENETKGVLVGTVRCTDIDAGPNKALLMEIDRSNGNYKYFSIDQNQEIKTTDNALDYEGLTGLNFQLELIVLAKDMPTAYPAKTGTATVIVTVLPVNEFNPVWGQFKPPITASPMKGYNIKENSPVGTLIAKAKAIDYDLGSDGEITYLLNTTGPEAALFRIDAITGDITVNSLIDADPKTGGNDLYHLQLMAEDGGGKSSVTCGLWILLDDVNDNTPHFGTSVYTASIAEKAPVQTNVVFLDATDNDISASLSFSIVSGDPAGKFQFDPTNASLLQLKSTIKPDKPSQDPALYRLKIKVEDGGVPVRTAEADVVIQVQLMNDHAPVFSPSPAAQVNENTIISTSVVKVTATDADSGDDKNIVYQITAGNTGDAFSISSKKGIIRVARNLDFETTPVYNLTIVASDVGTPPKSSSMVQVINIANTNDLPVVCSVDYIHIKTPEDFKVNREVTTLGCSDGDHLTAVTYRIEGVGSGLFQINHTGHITLIAALDYDNGPHSYSFDIRVSDGIYSTVVPMMVTVTPVNEYQPHFSDTNIIKQLAENAAIDSLVATVRVIDNDAPPHNVTKLWIENALSPATFRLEEKTGNIRLARELDYETKKSYSLSVVAVDGGNLKATSTVSVLVTDVNDNSPVCTESILHVSLAENEASGTLVSSLNCKDADSGTFGNLTYSLTQTPFGGNFIVNTVGKVILQGKSLDFETTKSYQLKVLVVDGGSKYTSVLLLIDVLDVNDGPPHFPNAAKTVSILENNGLMSIVTNIVANDPDDKTSPYGQLIYDIISGNNQQKFAIGRDSGQITLAGHLDREKTSIYILTITATESVSQNAASATASLTVSILDVNDNPPDCPFMSFHREVRENTLPGKRSQIITFPCTDPDTPAVGGTLKYSITVGDSSVFALINNTLILNAPLDFDKGRRQYPLTLTVSDSYFTVDIHGSVAVTPVDEYPPVFKSSHYSKLIPENRLVGQFLLTVNANDEDSSDTSDGVITYSLSSSNTLPFAIDGTTGQVSLISALDWETKKSYSFQVTAKDKSHSTSTTVSITVVDVNDNRPVFAKGYYSQEILETVSIGTNVIQVRASDADGPSNGNITFSIIGGNSGGEFDIVRETGQIKTIKLLDYDAMSVSSFTLRVKAADQNGASGSLSDTTLVTILLTSVNEYQPVFSQNTYLVKVKESEPIGFQFLQVSSSDKDKGPDGDVHYSITNNPLFVLDSVTGQFSLRLPLDFESSQRHVFDVTATDLGKPPKFGRATVVVNVENLNDEMPECPTSFLAIDIREDFATQKMILKLNCFDKDVGLYGQLNFLIEEVNGMAGSGPFKIDKNGQLSLASSLDYETDKALLLKIKVHDGGSMPHSTDVTVKITVVDVNEAAPVFDAFTRLITIAESTPIGHVVAKMSAKDSDLSDTLTYFFTTPSNEFEINPVNGEIKVKSSLDFESKQSFTLQITVADSGTVPKSLSAQTTLNIMLSDVNDSPPVFSSSVYQRNVQENEQAGTTVATLTVTDADSGSNALATFLIVSGDTTNTFLVSRDGAGNCDVYLATPSLLDYEKESQYSLVIRAKDSGKLSAEATLVIQVQPYNEYPPSFQNTQSNFPIKENLPIGTTLVKIVATDQDAGQDGTILYKLSGGHGKFIIDRHSGVITIRDQLDREQAGSYHLSVVAKDCGITPSALTSTLTLTVTVEDVNDHDPTCGGRQQNIVFVSEGAPIGENVFSFFCKDNDQDPAHLNNALRYAITKGNTAFTFAINATTGLLTTKTALDRELKASYELTVQVSDLGSPPRSIDQIVFIQIEDVNDNKPVFTSKNYVASVSESLDIANVVLKVTATDSDAGDAGAVLYSILSGDANHQFALDSLTGDLKLSNKLDRETVSSYTLNIQAIDRGIPPLSAQTVATVTVIDENDNSPLCSSTYYSVTIQENAKPNTPVISLLCKDSDAPANAALTYTIASGNAHSSFDIGSTTGIITVYSSVDAELQTKYLLSIDVSDKVHTTKIEVEILLQDINEFPPKFTPLGPFGTHVPEDFVIGSSIFEVHAKDDDASSTTIFFSFPAPNKYFNINKMTGVVSLNDHLDRETISTHTLTIEVTDNGLPHPLSNSAILTITVDDVNDNNPSCTKTHYVVSLPENTSVSTWVANISCSDVDTSSPVVKYTIEAGNSSGLFEVLSNSGQISLKKRLDFETTSLHTLDVRVDDNGTPKVLSTRVKLIVKVLPINEYPPTFGVIHNNIITVMENSSLGSLITWVNATDSDRGEDNGEFAFKIESGDSSGHFWIDSKTGEISLAQNLDRESKDSFTLNVIAKDCIHGYGQPQTATTTIRINVADTNDNYPEMVQTSYTLSVSENARNGTKLLTLDAHDDDFGPNSQIDFTIKSGDPTNRFTIIKNNLVVKDQLDFLKTKSYSLKIQVQDKGVPPLSSYAHVIIHVKPENDYPPTFSKGNASIILEENTTIGSIVYRVNVTDQDTGNSEGLNISISSIIPSNAPRHAFVIDNQRGEIRLAAPLDYDKVPNKFALIISVSDKGSPTTKPLSSTMTLSVTIENINDNAPVFSKSTYSFYVDENSPPNQSVGTVKAVDKDFDPFGSVSYHVVSSDTDGQDFELRQKDGIFFVNGSLDFERKKAYVYIVEAVDKGNPVKWGRCIVRIYINDLNDMPPKCSPSSYSLEVPENAPIGKSVIKVAATDADSAVNGNSDIDFSLTETTAAISFFRIDKVSGLITVHHSLDRETMAKHSLIAYATDNGKPHLTCSTKITIYVTDVNDNGPVFMGRYEATISEETHIGYVVFRLSAYDRDVGRNADITFDIIGGNTDVDFRLESTSGYLLTENSLDRERTPLYRIQIKASDGGIPQRTATTTVTIVIKDENDNPPRFGTTKYTFTLAENLPAPARVGQLVAFDEDIGRNALLYYKILFMLTGPNDFNIDGGTGVITSRFKLDRESVSYYKLWCEVSDGGTPSLSGNTEVHIYISDENDHIPTFRQDFFSTSVSEQSPIGTTVISFNVTDKDSANLGLITLSILPKVGDAILAGDYFKILNQNLVLKRRVDRELVSAFHFTMLAQDGGIPRLSSKATIDILVGDYNDHDPVFTKTFHDLEIAFDGSCTSFLTQVKAIDPDKDDNGRIAYYFIRSRYNYLFAINDITGDVRIQMGAKKNRIYVLTVNAHDYGSPQRRSSNNATLRIDTFDPKEIAASIQLGISRKDFEIEQTQFVQQLNALLRVKYPEGRFNIWCIQERDGEARSSPQAMRRLTANEKPVTVNVYCVKSNISSDQANVKQPKDLCSWRESLSFLTVEASGEISGALKGPAWDYYAIQKANRFGETDEVNWASTTNGIIIITLTCLLTLFIIGIAFGYCFWRRKRNSSVDPNGSTIEEKIASKDDEDLKKKLFRPNVLALPTSKSNNHSNDKLIDKSFDGRAIDPVSGRLYEYNKLTNESRWVPTPVNITPNNLL